MNNLKKELQELKEKVADLETRIAAEPVAKWEPKGGEWYVHTFGDVLHGGSVDKSRRFGAERATQAQAQRASIEMRRLNRLLALRDELCGDEEVDWKNCYREKHCLFFSHNHGEWHVSTSLYCENITPYFTDYELAQKACDMLNSGEVGL